jgi:hypothetical protein
MAAICKQESTNGTSQMIRTLNNVAGISWDEDPKTPHEGRWRRFATVDDSIYHLAYILKNFYIDIGKTDIVSIGHKYCPLSDPLSGKNAALNVHWIPNVKQFYEEIVGDIK